MSIENDIDDFLGGGGGKSAFTKNDSVGTTFAGTIVEIGKQQQQRDYVSGEPKTYDNGDPMMQLPVTLSCPDKADPSDAADTGLRTLYVKGQMRAALRDAVRTSGAKLRVGGHLSVTRLDDAKPERQGMNGAKQYRATYTAANPADSFLEDQPATGQGAPPAAAQPQPEVHVPAQQTATSNGTQAVQQAAASVATSDLPADRPGPSEANHEAAARLGLPLDVVTAVGSLPGGWDDPSAAAIVGMARSAAGAGAR